MIFYSGRSGLSAIYCLLGGCLEYVQKKAIIRYGLQAPANTGLPCMDMLILRLIQPHNDERGKKTESRRKRRLRGHRRQGIEADAAEASTKLARLALLSILTCWTVLYRKSICGKCGAKQNRKYVELEIHQLVLLNHCHFLWVITLQF